RQRMQTGGCVKALRELERAGHFVLPATGVQGRGGSALKSPRRLGEPVEVPLGVPAEAGDVRGLTLIKVDSIDQMRVWNELMLCEHPQGAGPLVGAQMRYLIGSEHGWLGGFGFGAAALQLADRDQWIGWDVSTRRQHLHRVVGMSRFLIRHSVNCHNLASRVLGMALRRIAADFETQYGYRPWLVESFVDTAQFAGTCYQAANWVAIGQTQGRGRQDRARAHAKSVKTVYVYVLEADLRTRLGVAEPLGLVPLAIADGLDGDPWADHEFGGARLGDRRLSERLVDSARRLAAMPGRAFCGVAQGDVAAVKAYYRLIDQPDDAPVSAEAILAPHHRRTLQRMKAQSTVLCIQDGTDLNYSGLARCAGLGVIGTNQTGAHSGGLHLHSTLVVSTTGLPLGVLGAQFSAPAPKHDERPASAIPIEEKKTFSWIQGLRQCVALAPDLPDTRLVCVMDREADVFELFDEQRQIGKVDLLVRAKHDRGTREDLNLFESVRQSPARGQLRIHVPRQSARPKKSKQKARDGHAPRTAQVVLRHRQVEFPPPPQHKGKEPITLWVVHVRETSPPADTQPIEWFLLTTREITTAAQAEECLRWYCLRWRIEDWHRVLKSGCCIEDLQHKTAERLKRAIAINLVIAWRIMLMTLLGRECPQLPATVLFSDIEIDVLAAYAKKNASPHLGSSAMPCVW
ncbi:MAG: IS4 family transposase, partial [Sulfuritalea sp.]|nr:IS4 family transposase [Sulfuritalea sp.]